MPPSPRRWPKFRTQTLRNRVFTQSDLVFIRAVIRRNPTWGRTRLSEYLSDLWGWRQPNGRLKDRACRVVLLKLESAGYIELPSRRTDTGGRPPRLDCSIARAASSIPVRSMPSNLRLDQVDTPAAAELWNSLIGTYHYLGLATSVGRIIRYLVYGDETLLGAISFSECAWRLCRRDVLLHRINPATQLSAVICNNRFLILPTVTVPNLASRILGAAARRIPVDWSRSYQTQPRFIETFVDLSRYSGTCYLAANWIRIGTTRGYSKRGEAHQFTNSPKALLMKGLNADDHHALLLAIRGEEIGRWTGAA